MLYPHGVRDTSSTGNIQHGGTGNATNVHHYDFDSVILHPERYSRDGRNAFFRVTQYIVIIIF